MARRLQVVLRDTEYREIQSAARARHMSIAEWVRHALGLGLRRERSTPTWKKLEAVREAARHDFPTGDMESILAEIDGGYRSDSES